VKNRAALAFRLAANSLHRSQSYLGNYFRRMRAKLGAPKAITAAHRLARIVYHLRPLANRTARRFMISIRSAPASALPPDSRRKRPPWVSNFCLCLFL
jgi:hypothetical protein